MINGHLGTIGIGFGGGGSRLGSQLGHGLNVELELETRLHRYEVTSSLEISTRLRFVGEDRHLKDPGERMFSPTCQVHPQASLRATEFERHIACLVEGLLLAVVDCGEDFDFAIEKVRVEGQHTLVMGSGGGAVIQLACFVWLNSACDGCLIKRARGDG